MNQLEKRIRNWIGLGHSLIWFAAFGVGAGLLLLTARADDAAQASRAARLSSVVGQVQISQGAVLVTDQAVANAPLFEGMSVATAEDGRAEIQLEDGSVARLSPNSSLTLTVLRGQGDAGQAEVVLESGLAYFEVQAGADRILFGDSVVTASGFTVMRINLDNPPGDLAVFSGNAHLERGSALTLDLHGGESLVLNGADASRYDLTESIEPDSWDSWNSDRDQVLTGLAASKTGATKSYADSSNPVDAKVWLHLGVELFLGLFAVPVRKLELLRQLWLGLDAGDGRLLALVGQRLRRPQHRDWLRRLSSPDSSPSAAASPHWPGRPF